MAVRVYWESFEHLLSDYDLINVTIEPDVVPADVVDFRLTAGEGITWWKGLYVPDGLGSAWEVSTEGSRTSASVALWAHQVHNGQDIELRKAKFLNQHIYVLGNLERLAGGSRVTFSWVQDDDPRHMAWVTDAHVDLPLRDGRYRVPATETFRATLQLWNIDGDLWTRDARYKLGSYTPADNTTWGLSRVELPYSRAVVEFEITARAPATPGEYPFRWRMVQEGVGWFGDSWGPTIIVDPPPPPNAGQVSVGLIPVSALTYEVNAADPSNARHAVVESVTNATDHLIFLAHQDRAGQHTAYIPIDGHARLTTPFAPLEVEGRWRAVFHGSGPPPPALSLVLDWRVP